MGPALVVYTDRLNNVVFYEKRSRPRFTRLLSAATEENKVKKCGTSETTSDEALKVIMFVAWRGESYQLSLFLSLMCFIA